MKNKGLTPEIQWSILKGSNTLKSFDSRCNLCLEEKIQIMIYQDPEKLLNKRCRHRAKFKDKKIVIDNVLKNIGLN